MTYFKWTEAVIGKIQAVTPKEGDVSSGVITDAQHIKTALGYDRAKVAKDVRPVLIYFHWPHEHKAHGKLSETICTKVLNDEQAARWSKLFRCVQIDMGETETKFSEMIGEEGKPSFVALDGNPDSDLSVVARIDATKSGSKLRKALEAAFEKFPEARKAVKQDLAEQKKMMAKAKKLEKAKKYEEALEIVDKIRFGDLRIGKDWDKAYAYGMKLALKAEQELDK